MVLFKLVGILKAVQVVTVIILFQLSAAILSRSRPVTQCKYKRLHENSVLLTHALTDAIAYLDFQHRSKIKICRFSI